MAVCGEARLNSHLSPSEFAKRKLILAAIRVFAEHGVDSVSLRMINREAGHKNNSALHYHFGSKMGLIEAMDDFIQQHFDEVREPQLAELECSVNEGKASIRDAMEVFVNPYVQIINGHEWGYDAVRTLARMEFDSNEQVHRLLSQSAGKATNRFAKAKRAILKDMPLRRFKMRLNFVVNFTIQGFADYRNLNMSYLGNLSPKNLDELANFYVDMGEAVFTAPN